MTKLHVDLFIEYEERLDEGSIVSNETIPKLLQQLLSDQWWIKNFNFTTIGD